MTTTLTTDQGAAVRAAIAKMGRKLTDADVNTAFAEYAEEYARTYRGSFDFMRDMREKVEDRGYLSIPQARGVLNCVRAEINRRPAATEDGGQSLLPGVYRTPGGVIRVVMNRAKTGLYAKRQINIGGERLNEDGETLQAEWEYEAGLIRFVKPEYRMTEDEAREHLLVYGECAVCGRHLKDATSVKRAIGPVCYEKLAR